MKKSIKTRIKITKKGKAITRKIAQCHFRAKRSSTEIHRSQKPKLAPKAIVKKVLKKPGNL